MTHRRTARLAGALAAGAAVGAAGLLVVAGPAEAAPKAKAKKAAVVGRAEVPLGLQGLRGAGGNVVVPFTLVDATRRSTDIEVAYGIDYNADGTIAEDEYRLATEDRLDSRNTRKNRKPQLWVTAGDIGATHAFVWRSTADIQTGRYESLMYRNTDQGRRIADPNNPGEFLFDDAQAGVRVRVRAVRGTGKNKAVGAWVVTDSFSLNNNTAPSMTIDAILPNPSGTASDENVTVQWTGIDPDSEDVNGNGVFDPGEDANGDGIFNQEQLGVAFDYYRLQPGDDPTSMTDDEIGALPWKACTRAAGLGDSDSFRETGAGKVYGTANGRAWTFVWNSVADVGTVRDQFIMRARPVDQKRENGAAVYVRTPFVIDNLKVFASAAAGNAEIALSSARTGVSVTNLVYGLERSDGSYGAPFQQVVVAGGSTTPAGNGTTGVDIFLVNSESADSTAASRVQFVSFATARKYHSATALSDGRVLFAGGFDANGNPTNTTEIYDPATRTMSAGPTLVAARARHTAVRLSSHDVAFIGGIGAGNTALDSIEVYHFTGVGAEQQPNTALPRTLSTPQHSASAVVLGNQKVLICNGIAGTTDAGAATGEAYLLDPLANPLAAGTPGGVKPKAPTLDLLGGASAPGVPRKFAAVTPLVDGNALISGGVSGGAVVSSLEVFNWQTGAFEAVDTPMADARAQHVAAQLGDGTVLLAGGATSDPSGGNPTVTGKATVLEFLGQTAGTWNVQYNVVNGDMVVPRRGADRAVIMNGRPFIAGGLGASGQPTATAEVYVPEGSRNFAPKAYVALPSSDLSHAYGAPLNYRVIDAESDRARVEIQFRIPGGTSWNACTPQSGTLGGDVGENTANLATTTNDIDNDILAIDPVARNTTGDHIFIWAMSQDIDRPDPNDGRGGRIDGYNLRVIPYGAVRGQMDVSDPVNVFYNTKPLSYIVPLEDAIGVVNPNQGGDIDVWAHVRDIDGEGTGPRPGNISAVRFEYAIDANNDGQISPVDGEFFGPMTPAGFAISGFGSNPVTGIQSWSEGPLDPSSDIASRDPSKGWVRFTWDALYDLGPPQSPGYNIRNIWIKATPSDDPLVTGFPYILRNRPGVPDQFVYVRDGQALWMEKFYPISAGPSANGPFNSVRANEPVVIEFNGVLDPASVNLSTVKIYRQTTQVLGAYKVEPNVPVAGKSRVTFFPQVQDSNAGVPVYTLTSAQTIMFAFNEYRIAIPGYAAQRAPRSDTPATIRPENWGTNTSTYQVVNSGVINGDADSQYRFNTTSGIYNDGQDFGLTGSVPISGGTVPQINGSSPILSMAYSHALDYTTLMSPSLTVTGALGQSYVVPGRWSVQNTMNSDGTSSALASFVPLRKLPPGDAITVTANSGVRGSNGLSATGSGSVTFAVASGSRTTASQTETFTNTTMKDTATTASWGEDACDAGVLTGLQDGSTQPSGTSDLTVSGTTTLTGTLYNYRNITINRGGRLVIRASSPVTIMASGTITINGTVDFAGQEGNTGSCGNFSAYQYGPTNNSATRPGGIAYNGGGAGGNSTGGSSYTIQTAGNVGNAGTGTVGTGGAGGPLTTSYGSSYSYYYYGVGGGAGGGHGQRGLPGGTPSNYTSPLSAQPAGGSVGGAADFSTSGITGGGGGGGGGTSVYSSTGYFQNGGGGGSGAGALTFLTTGSFILNSAGYINGQGGQGGSKSHYGGAGGGGAGGALWIKSGGPVVLDGLIDLRGGRGGPAGFGYFSDTYPFYNTTVYGTTRFGGDGGGGRLMVEAPNYVAGTVDQVRVFGAMTVRQVAALPTTTIAASTLPSQLSGTSGLVGTQTLDLGGVTDVRYSSSVDIPSTRVVRLRNGTNTAGRALRMWVDGNVTISGVLDVNGNGAALMSAITTVDSSWIYDYAPLTSSQVGYTMFGNYTTTSASIYTTGYYGVAGGGVGGRPMGNTTTGNTNNNTEAGDGGGPMPGRHNMYSGTAGYVYSSSYPSWNYYCGDAGGGGAGGAGPGREGWSPYAVHTAYNYRGGVTDSTGAGVTGATRLTNGGAAGQIVDTTTLSVTNIANYVGSGGGGGNAGGWGYNPYYGYAGFGGGGGGSVAIICQGTIRVNAGGRVEAFGGDGNPPGMAYPYYYSHAAGGGGSGGTVYLAGNNVVIATAASESTSSGATFDMRGGFGGGWRQPWSGVRNAYQWYNAHNHFGGDGGYGRLVIDWRTSLNSRTNTALVNAWGYQQNSFHDATQQYRSLGGSATFKCRGIPKSNYFQSKFYDLGSLNPTVTAMTVGLQQNLGSLSLSGRGAQSHPFNAGTGGTGEADPSNIMPTSVTGSASMSTSGWRWWRFEGSFTRFASTGGAPRIDGVGINYVTDL